MTNAINTLATHTVRADEVTAGDLVIGYIQPGTSHLVRHAEPYTAAPVANDPNCQCPSHQELTDDDKNGPLAVLTDAEPWDACDVMPAHDQVVIAEKTLAPDYTLHPVIHRTYQPGQTVTTKGPYPIRHTVRCEVDNFRGEPHIVTTEDRWVPLSSIEGPCD